MGLSQSFSRPVRDLIKERISIRGYDDREIPPEIIGKINNFMHRLPNLFDAQLRMEILQISSLEKDAYLKLGSYKVIRGTNTFLAVAHPKDKRNLLNAGYVVEHVVLYAQSLGLGTCWLSLTFNRDAFASALQLKGNEIIPVIVSMGYPQTGIDLIGGYYRTLAKSRTRKPWKELFFDEDFSHPLSRQNAGEFSLALDMVRLSPSGYNHQPWRILKQGERFHFYIFRKILPENKRKTGFNMAFLDCGICMAHFELIAQTNGLIGEWIQQDPLLPNQSKELTYVASWKPLAT